MGKWIDLMCPILRIQGKLNRGNNADFPRLIEESVRRQQRTLDSASKSHVRTNQSCIIGLTVADGKTLEGSQQKLISTVSHTGKDYTMMNKLDAALSFHQTALRVRNERQELLASNIANADTPQYKARDLDFKSAMQAALNPSVSSTGASANTTGNGAMQQTNTAHLPGQGSRGYLSAGDPLFRSVVQGSVDGNTVDMDVERNAYVDNGIRYEASLTMITGQIKKMLSAINGQ